VGCAAANRCLVRVGVRVRVRVRIRVRVRVRVRQLPIGAVVQDVRPGRHGG